MLTVQNTLELLQKVSIENLYQNLIEQINKDFQLSNLSENFEISNTPVQLKEKLSTIIQDLIINHYDDYLNLLYRVDVPEKELLAIKSDNSNDIVNQITFLILKREYQKVWFKNRF